MYILKLQVAVVALAQTEYSSFNDLNEIYRGLRDYDDFIIVSDEIGKSKPATLFFLRQSSLPKQRVAMR